MQHLQGAVIPGKKLHSVGFDCEKRGFGFSIHERCSPFPSLPSIHRHTLHWHSTSSQLFILLISAAEEPSAIGAFWGTWQDFFHPLGLVAVHYWRYSLPRKGEEIMPCWGITAMSLNAGHEQLQSFWEVKGEVLQHTQPGVWLAVVFHSWLHPWLSRIPKAQHPSASHHAALAFTRSPQARVHYCLLQVPPRIRSVLEHSPILSVCWVLLHCIQPRRARLRLPLWPKQWVNGWDFASHGRTLHDLHSVFRADLFIYK